MPRWRTGLPRCSAALPASHQPRPGGAAAVALVPREWQAVIEPDDIELTPRERDVLVLMAEGASNKAIARRLGISVHTAKFHVGSLLDKLDATGRTDAVAHAARRGVINL